jgi:hypothetical protein
MADKEHDEALHDEEDRQRPTAEEEAEAKKAVRPSDGDPVKRNALEYFGADGEDEGQKFMQNADGSWGDPGPAG